MRSQIKSQFKKSDIRALGGGGGSVGACLRRGAGASLNLPLPRLALLHPPLRPYFTLISLSVSVPALVVSLEREYVRMTAWRAYESDRGPSASQDRGVQLTSISWPVWGSRNITSIFKMIEDKGHERYMNSHHFLSIFRKYELDSAAPLSLLIGHLPTSFS